MINSVLLLLAVTASQTHTPSATVSGDIVTVDASFAALPENASVIGAELLQGTPVVFPSGYLAASEDGVSPIKWRLPPGQYDITAYGFSDDRSNPDRVKATLSVTITGPTREQQIGILLQQLALALFDAGQARTDLQTLNPTRQEILDSLSNGEP